MLQKYLKYKNKYLNEKKQKGGDMDTVIVKKQGTDNKILISFKYGFIYDYERKKSYLLHHEQQPNVFKLLDIYDNPISRKFLKYNADGQDPNNKWQVLNNDMSLKYDIYGYQHLPPINYNIYNKKIVIFIRHGESMANVHGSHMDFNLVELSARGKQQAVELKNKLIRFDTMLKASPENSTFYHYRKGIQAAIISPLKRTLLTGLPTFQQLPNLPIKVTPLCSEYANTRSDMCFSRSQDYLDWVPTTGLVNHNGVNNRLSMDNANYDKWANILWKNFDDKNDGIVFDHRLRLFEEYIKKQKENVIMVVSHGQFIYHYFNKIIKSPNYNIQLDNTGFIATFHE